MIFQMFFFYAGKLSRHGLIVDRIKNQAIPFV